MRTLYLECAMGAAGDMLMAALYELCSPEDRAKFLADMGELIPGVVVLPQAARRQGVAGTHMSVLIHGREEGALPHDHRHDHDHEHEHEHEHHHDHEHGHDHSHSHLHRSLADVLAVIDGFVGLPAPVRERAKAVYALIAQAEARAHGVAVGEVHFHEVGALDAVVDVTGVCYLAELLAPDHIVCSPVAVGSGTVRTAHGLLPVPAPATAYLLEGLPVAAGDVAAELCTPTGAALLKALADSFGPLPAGRLLGCGCGCGTKDFPRANCLRALLLDTAGAAQGPNDAVTELRANIDDMTGEALGFALEALLSAGALDVSYLPIQMKKNRPGVLLLCLCRPEEADRLAAEILRHTTTFGVRRTDCSRYALTAASVTEHTAYGPIRRKEGMGYGVTKSKAEYADLARIAQEQKIPLSRVPELLERG